MSTAPSGNGPDLTTKTMAAGAPPLRERKRPATLPWGGGKSTTDKVLFVETLDENGKVIDTHYECNEPGCNETDGMGSTLQSVNTAHRRRVHPSFGRDRGALRSIPTAPEAPAAAPKATAAPTTSAGRAEMSARRAEQFEKVTRGAVIFYRCLVPGCVKTFQRKTSMHAHQTHHGLGRARQVVVPESAPAPAPARPTPRPPVAVAASPVTATLPGKVVITPAPFTASPVASSGLVTTPPPAFTAEQMLVEAVRLIGEASKQLKADRTSTEEVEQLKRRVVDAEAARRVAEERLANIKTALG